MPLGTLTPQTPLPDGYRRNPRTGEMEPIPVPSPNSLIGLTPGQQGTGPNGQPTYVQPSAPVSPAMVSLTGQQSGPADGVRGQGVYSGADARPAPSGRPEWMDALDQAQSVAVANTQSANRQAELDRQQAARDMQQSEQERQRAAQSATPANRTPIQSSGGAPAPAWNAEALRQREDEQRTADIRASEDAKAAAVAAQAGRLTEQRTGAQQNDANAASASARASADRDKLLGQIPGLMSSLTGGSGSPPTGTPAVDPQVARDAAFARAKDKIGQIQRGAITSLREGMAERGTLGGGLESGAMASLLGEGQEQLGDVVRDQTISDLDQQNRVADRNYAGDLTRRGQNLGLSQSLLSLLGRAY